MSKIIIQEIDKQRNLKGIAVGTTINNEVLNVHMVISEDLPQVGLPYALIGMVKDIDELHDIDEVVATYKQIYKAEV